MKKILRGFEIGFCVLFLFTGVFYCKYTFGDDYFNQVIKSEYEKINLDPVSFKIEIFDEMEINDFSGSHVSRQGKNRAGYLFQTDGNQVRIDEDIYDPVGLTNEIIANISRKTHKTESDLAFLKHLKEHCLNKPTTRDVTIRDKRGNVKAVNVHYSAGKTSYVLVICEPQDTFRIGLGESGTYAVNKKIKSRRRMTSMILSPCFAPLDISPKDISKHAKNVVK